MKLWLIALLSTVSMAASAEGLYIGITTGLETRSGLILGWRVNPSTSLEYHFGGLPPLGTRGLSLKHYLGNSRTYSILGFTKVDGVGHDLTEYRFKGVNLGLGHEFGLNGDDPWSFPIEAGLARGWNIVDKKLENSFFIDGGVLFGSKNN